MRDSSSRHAAAVALLHALSGAEGIHASASDTVNYRAVFTRDAVMAGVAGVLTSDPRITSSFAATLRRLRALQGHEGQIASNYEIGADGQAAVSFGSLAPRFDGMGWYLVGVALAVGAGVVDAGEFADSVRRVVRLLDGIEYNGRHLLYLPTGGNWADEYPYDGYILCDQVLRAWGLRLCGAVFGEPSWVVKSRQITARIEEAYWPDTGSGDARPYPLAAFSPSGQHEVFDLAACALLAVSGLAPARASAVLEWISATFVTRGELPPAFHPTIDEADAGWPALRRYHRYAFRNAPHEYHNGGVWPIWLGWLALGQARHAQHDALAALRRVTSSRLDAHPDFDFHEFLHGVTYLPGGTPRMAYSATGLLFLQAADSTTAARLLAS